MSASTYFTASVSYLLAFIYFYGLIVSLFGHMSNENVSPHFGLIEPVQPLNVH